MSANKIEMANYYKVVYGKALRDGMTEHGAKKHARTMMETHYPQSSKYIGNIDREFLGRLGAAARSARIRNRNEPQQAIQPTIPQFTPDPLFVDERAEAVAAWQTLMAYVTNRHDQLNGQRQIAFTALSQLLRLLGQ